MWRRYPGPSPLSNATFVTEAEDPDANAREAHGFRMMAGRLPYSLRAAVRNRLESARDVRCLPGEATRTYKWSARYGLERSPSRWRKDWTRYRSPVGIENVYGCVRFWRNWILTGGGPSPWGYSPSSRKPPNWPHAMRAPRRWKARSTPAPVFADVMRNSAPQPSATFWISPWPNSPSASRSALFTAMR